MGADIHTSIKKRLKRFPHPLGSGVLKVKSPWGDEVKIPFPNSLQMWLGPPACSYGRTVITGQIPVTSSAVQGPWGAGL